MACELTAPDAVQFTELACGIGAAHLPGEHLRTHRLEILAHGLRTADILYHNAFLSPLVNEIMTQEGDDEVR